MDGRSVASVGEPGAPHTAGGGAWRGLPACAHAHTRLCMPGARWCACLWTRVCTCAHTEVSDAEVVLAQRQPRAGAGPRLRCVLRLRALRSVPTSRSGGTGVQRSLRRDFREKPDAGQVPENQRTGRGAQRSACRAWRPGLRRWLPRHLPLEDGRAREEPGVRGEAAYWTRATGAWPGAEGQTAADALTETDAGSGRT